LLFRNSIVTRRYENIDHPPWRGNTHVMTLRGYFDFLEANRARLIGISKRACGEYTLADLQQAAWIAAVELGQERGREIDFGIVSDRETVLSRLYLEVVRRADKRVRFAVRIDQADEDEQGLAARVKRELAADTKPVGDDADPDEEDVNWAEAVRGSYSEAAAYAILLRRFEWNRRALAEHLRITLATLRDRVGRAVAWAMVQPSLFDGINLIDEEFVAARARERACRHGLCGHGTQVEWDFDQALAR
jgi:hypothetical protein